MTGLLERGRRMSTVVQGARRAALLNGRLEGDWLQSLPRRIQLLSELARTIMEGHRVVLQIDGSLPPPGSLIACNHLSYLDPLVILAVVPAMPVAKGEVAHWPIIGQAGRDAGVLFHERTRVEQGATVLRRMIRALAAGVSVLNFPEGTTSFGETLLPFKRGMFGVARRAGAPVVPTLLSFDDRAMCWVGDQGFLPHYADLVGRTTTRGRLRFGVPIDPAGFESAESLSSAVRSAMTALSLLPTPR